MKPRSLLLAGLLAASAIGHHAGGQTGHDGDPLPNGAIGRLGTTRFRHDGPIAELAFLPDGKTIASVGRYADPTIALWDIATGKKRRQYRVVVVGFLDGVCLSPDHTRVAMADTEGFAMCELATGKQTYRLGPMPKQPDNRPFAFAFSGDGRVVAHTRGGDQRVHVHDAATGNKLQTLQFATPSKVGASSLSPALTLSPDGKRLVTAVDTADGTECAVWDLASGKRLGRFPSSAPAAKVAYFGQWIAHQAPDLKHIHLRSCANGEVVRTFATSGFAGFAWAAGDNTIAIATETQIRAFNARNLADVTTLPCGDLWVTQLALSRDGRRLAVIARASSGDALVVWDVATRKELWRAMLPAWRIACGCAKFSDDGTLLAVASAQAIRLWDVASGKQRHIAGHDAAVAHLALAQAIRLWDVASGKQRHIAGHDAAVAHLALAPDGRHVTAVTEDGTAHFWDARTQCETRPPSKPLGAGGMIELTSDGKRAFHFTYRFMSCDPIGNALYMWDTATGRLLRKYHGPSDRCYGGSVTRDGRTVAWQGQDGTVRVDDVESGQPRAKLKLPDGVYIARYGDAFSPDGRRLAAIGGPKAACRFWHCDVATGRVLPALAGLDSPLCLVCYAPDGRTLAGLTQRDNDPAGKQIHLWEVATGAECLRLDLPAQGGHALAISPDGRQLAVGCDAGTIRLCEVHTGASLGELRGHRGPVHLLRFAPDAATLYSAARDTSLLIWDMAPLRPKPLAAGDLDTAWADLGCADAAKAYRAMAAFAGTPKRAVALLAARLQPIQAPDAWQLQRWIGDLDADDFDTRQTAMAALARCGELSLPAARAALKTAISVEARRRLEQLVEPLEHGRLPAEVLHRVRAVQVLETIGTPEARKVLTVIATGASAARQTREAREAQDRLAQRVPAGHPLAEPHP